MKKLLLIVLALFLGGMTTVTLAETISGQSQSYHSGFGHSQTSNGKTMAFYDSNTVYWPRKTQDNVHIFDGRSAADTEDGVVIGKFHFSRVADTEVYYGDWSQNGVEDNIDHIAYFSGKNATPAVPTSGQATYTLAGINQFDGEAKLTGTFEANFADKSYIGSLQGQSLAIALDGSIEGNGAFSGNAIANQSEAGLNSGQFFGDHAEHVAGITIFEDNHQLDTSFGGSKTGY